MAVLLDETTRKQTAREVCLLLNEAIRELVIPLRLHALTENLPEGPVWSAPQSSAHREELRVAAAR